MIQKRLQSRDTNPTAPVEPGFRVEANPLGKVHERAHWQATFRVQPFFVKYEEQRSFLRGPRSIFATRVLRPVGLAIVLLLASGCADGGGEELGSRPRLGPEEIVRGPQLALATETSMVVAWSSDAMVVGSVEYGETAGYGQEVALAAPALDHVVTLTGLTPGTLYHYGLKHDDLAIGGDHQFDTIPADPLAPLRFVVLGDAGSGLAPQYDVADQIGLSMPDLVLITGDVVYESGAPSELDPRYFTPYQFLIDRIPFVATLGNHDVRTDNGRPLLDALYLPTNSQDFSERFYSFDRGDSHFIALNTNDPLRPGSPQYDWLEADLAGTSATWIFLFFHHPPYSSSRHGGQPSIRSDLVPLFDQYAVDLVFSGHDHDYERTFPLAGGVVVDSDPANYLDPPGTLYIVTGGGGRALYKSRLGAFTAFSESAYHMVQVDVNDLRLTLTAIDESGAELDRMVLTKSVR